MAMMVLMSPGVVAIGLIKWPLFLWAGFKDYFKWYSKKDGVVQCVVAPIFLVSTPLGFIIGSKVYFIWYGLKVCILIFLYGILVINLEYWKYGLKNAFKVPFEWFLLTDEPLLSNQPKILTCCGEQDRESPESPERTSTAFNQNSYNFNARQKTNQQKPPNHYWDLFIKQSIKTTKNLLTKNWIKLEDIEVFDSSILQSIPMVAILEVLIDSVESTKSKEIGEEDLIWKVVKGPENDGRESKSEICDKNTRPVYDNVVKILWPKILKCKKLVRDLSLSKNINPDQISNYLSAMICNNVEEEFLTSDLKNYLKEHENILSDNNGNGTNPELYKKLNEIKVILKDLEICISRISAFKDKQSAIYTFDYGNDQNEGQINADKSSNHSSEELLPSSGSNASLARHPDLGSCNSVSEDMQRVIMNSLADAGPVYV